MFALRAPQDLLHRFNGQPWAVRCSLKTSDLRQANDKARTLHAEWAEKFASMRRQDNPQWVTLTPALTQHIAAEVRRWVLAADDNLRMFPEGPQALADRDKRQQRRGAVAEALARIESGESAGRDFSALRIDQAPLAVADTDPLAGLTDEQGQALAQFNGSQADAASADMARRNRRGVLPLAEMVTKSMGLMIDWQTPEGAECLAEVLKAHRQATADAVRRDAGEVVDTPEPQQPQEAPGRPQTAKATHTPTDAFNAWDKAKPGRPRKTVATYRAAADQLAAMLPGRSLESLTREDGRDIVAALLKVAQARGGASQNTAVTRLSRFKTLLAQAVDLEWIPRSPLQGRTIGRVQSSRKPWKTTDLVRLFADPIFTAYTLPRASMAGKDAAYWLPLLGLFTGARISELAQLGIDDLTHNEEAGWCLSIHEEQEDQSVKNQHSIRTVPVHPELFRLGLIDYRQAMKDAGAVRLWPAVVFSELNGAGGKISEWFGDFKEAKGFGGELVFHSFRHTLETELRALSVPKYHIAALAGHAPEDVSDGYAHPTPTVLRPHLERLRFPGLVLPRVFTVPAWKPSGPRGRGGA